MARGFESKSVEHQQDLASGPLRERPQVGDPVVVVKRRKLEMTLVETRRQLDAAHAEPHREMLRRAVASLESDLRSLG
ncbi:MAG TPA: hypothetical protein VMV21_07355 [Vicinamibacteria bacterium]|nr:hypothetical protein [Vicinamibacteria bacterium]